MQRVTWKTYETHHTVLHAVALSHLYPKNQESGSIHIEIFDRT